MRSEQPRCYYLSHEELEHRSSKHPGAGVHLLCWRCRDLRANSAICEMMQHEEENKITAEHLITAAVWPIGGRELWLVDDTTEPAVREDGCRRRNEVKKKMMLYYFCTSEFSLADVQAGFSCFWMSVSGYKTGNNQAPPTFWPRPHSDHAHILTTPPEANYALLTAEIVQDSTALKPSHVTGQDQILSVIGCCIH